jgi:hypothetical protein
LLLAAFNSWHFQSVKGLTTHIQRVLVLLLTVGCTPWALQRVSCLAQRHWQQAYSPTAAAAAAAAAAASQQGY